MPGERKNLFEHAYDDSTTGGLLFGVIAHNVGWLAATAGVIYAGSEFLHSFGRQRYLEAGLALAGSAIAGGIAWAETQLADEQMHVLQARVQTIPTNHNT